MSLFADALIGNSAPVVAAVAGIDHNRALAKRERGQSHEPGQGRGRNKTVTIHQIGEDEDSSPPQTDWRAGG